MSEPQCLLLECPSLSPQFSELAVGLLDFCSGGPLAQCSVCFNSKTQVLVLLLPTAYSPLTRMSENRDRERSGNECYIVAFGSGRDRWLTVWWGCWVSEWSDYKFQLTQNLTSTVSSHSLTTLYNLQNFYHMKFDREKKITSLYTSFFPFSFSKQKRHFHFLLCSGSFECGKGGREAVDVTGHSAIRIRYCIRIFGSDNTGQKISMQIYLNRNITCIL